MARRESENYRKSSKKGKSYISRQLVQQMRALNPACRFLKRDSDTGEWEDVGDDVAREKASQVLRDAVALLPDESSDPLPVDIAEPQPTTSYSYPAVAASIPVSVDESERSQSAYSQSTTPMLHHPTDLPVPTPVTSYRKRRRHHYYGYEGFYAEAPHSPTRSPPAQRRYPSQHQQHHHHHHQQQQQHYSYPPPIHTCSRPPRSHHYEAYNSSRDLEPPLPRSHSELARQQQRTNKPPTVSARQASTASAQSLLGSLQSGMNEFDLFNGELIDSDHEEQKRSRRSPPDVL